MAHYITCPVCRASLKANKLPLTTKQVTCPECGGQFEIPGVGVTAKPASPEHAADSTAETAGLPLVRTTPRAWLPVALVGAILVAGGGVAMAILLTRQAPPHVPLGAQIKDRDPSTSEKEESAKTDTDKAKELEQRRERFTQLMIDGGTALNTKKFEEAVTAYTEAVKLFPDHADAKAKLAEAQTALAKLRQVQEEANKLREEAITLAKQGQAALADRQFAAAIDFFKLALQKDASLSEASQGLLAAQSALQRSQLDQKKIEEYEALILSGKAAQKAGRYADAIRDFMSAQRLVPDDEIAKQLQREAEKQLDAVIDRGERLKEFQRLLAQGDAALKSRAYEDAEMIFQRAVRLFPNDAAALNGLEESQKKLKAAKLEYAKWMVQGNAAANAGRYGEAVLAYREATRLFPNDDAATKALRLAELAQDGQNTYFRAMERGVQAMRAGLFADAVVAYREALSVAPLDPAASRGLADAQRALEADLIRRKDFERKVLAGRQLLSQQRYSEAAAEFRAALKIMNHHPEALRVERQADYAEAMAKGVAALNGRRFQEAIAHFSAALDLVPNDPAAMAGLKQARAGAAKGGKS
ncbi:MAG: tetratricopeptide repeat protein [Gemmataceae bacterium]|nr:tetratricopeptide repeat protein [Gemmataceae bacterium]